MEEIVRNPIQRAIFLADSECIQIAVRINDPVEGVFILRLRNRCFVEGNVLAEEVLPLGPVGFGKSRNRHGCGRK